MNRFEHTQRSDLLEEAVTILFCPVDDGYQNINPNAQCYESLRKLSDSEVITLALTQQLRGMESQRSFLRDASRFFSHLFPGVIGLASSSLYRRTRKLVRKSAAISQDAAPNRPRRASDPPYRRSGD
jgi:hypothetical protein